VSPEEWRALVDQANRDISGIIQSQRTLREVRKELDERLRHPIEEDFIFADGLRHDPRMPRVIEVDGVQLVVRVLHRQGLEQTDVKGADLLYEISGSKFVLVQYKKADSGGRIRKTAQQLDDLIGACPNPCPPPMHGFYPSCGSWISVIAARGQDHYMPACRVSAIFGPAASRRSDHFAEGISQTTFQQLFARCWIGARISPADLAYLTWARLDADRVLFSALQIGLFGS
jgi:hypothetical protein